LIVHGWPGSFYEFHDIIDPLTNPPADQVAFHVIIPSVPGFAFSQAPAQRGWTAEDTARLLNKLMSDVLGYNSYAVQGGDWGALISTLLSEYPNTKAVHLNMCPVPPPYSPILMGLVYLMPHWISSRIVSWAFSPEEWAQMLRIKDFTLKSTGYFAIQATQPFTLGLALNDSPLGLLAWIGEKYHAHVDPTFNLPPSTIITTVSIYYHTQSFASSCLPYFENAKTFGKPPTRIAKAVLGVSMFKHDILILPESWVSKFHPKLVFWRMHDKGGHFPALDNPDVLVGDLREMMATHRNVF